MECVLLFFDNTSAVNMAKNTVQHKKTKHIDIRRHFLSNNVKKGLVKMVFNNTEDQIISIFTKALNRDQFERNCMKLGLMKLN